MRILAVLLAVLLAAAGSAAAESVVAAPESIEDAFARYDPGEEETLGDLVSDETAPDSGVTNILLIGLDARPRQITGRSDTMILLTLDADHRAIKLISFMRDLYVEIPGYKDNRLNAAYVFGGAPLLMDTLEANFGVRADFYVVVNFSVLADVIDQLGGLTLTVEERYVPRVNAVIRQDNKVLGVDLDDGLLEAGGTRLLTGKQAQAYARYRYGTSDGDFGRTVRQREVVLKCIEKLRAMSMASLARMAIDNLDAVTTNMSVLDMIALAPTALSLMDSDVRELRIPIDGGYTNRTISGMAVLSPDRTANTRAIAAFLQDS